MLKGACEFLKMEKYIKRSNNAMLPLQLLKLVDVDLFGPLPIGKIKIFLLLFVMGIF